MLGALGGKISRDVIPLVCPQAAVYALCHRDSEARGKVVFSKKTSAVAALLISLTLSGIAGASPAVAETSSARAVYAASGSITCPAGKYAYVHVYVYTPGTVTFSTSRGRLHSSYGTDHTYVYPGNQGNTLNWRVSSSSNIGTVTDNCTSTP